MDTFTLGFLLSSGIFLIMIVVHNKYRPKKSVPSKIILDESIIEDVLDVRVFGANHDKILRIAQKAIDRSDSESHFFQLKRNVVFQIVDLKLEELIDGRIIAFLVLKDIIDGRVILVDSMSASAILKPKKTNRIFDPSQITEKS